MRVNFPCAHNTPRYVFCKYPQAIFSRYFFDDDDDMDKYEIRRRNFQLVIDLEFNGNAAAFARKIDKDSSYINRCLYEDGKSGKKRIGDALVEAACKALGKPPGWYDIPKWLEPIDPLTHNNAPDKNVIAHANHYHNESNGIKSPQGGRYDLLLIPDKLPILDGESAVNWQESIAKYQSNTTNGMITNIPINPSMFKYRVIGDTMSPLFIEGDILAIDPTRHAKNAQYVLAEINGDPAVRQLMRIDGEWWLTLKNTAYADMKKPLTEVKIIGVVVAKIPPPTLYI